jgi:hypothetical protein
MHVSINGTSLLVSNPNLSLVCVHTNGVMNSIFYSLFSCTHGFAHREKAHVSFVRSCVEYVVRLHQLNKRFYWNGTLIIDASFLQQEIKILF